MSRHCVQIKSMLESKRLSKSKFNIQLSTKHLPEPTPQIKQLKRSQSSSSLIKQGTSEIFLIEERYRKLEQNYRSILEETRNNSMLFAKQKTELERLKIENSKDKKQIERLRKMLGFVKECKVQKGVQVQRQMEEITSYDKDLSKISNDSKVEQSTDAGSRDTQDNWKVKETRKSTKKQSRVRTPYKLLNNKSQTTIFMRSPLKQSNISKSPLSRYKFVPTISFN